MEKDTHQRQQSPVIPFATLNRNRNSKEKMLNSLSPLRISKSPRKLNQNLNLSQKESSKPDPIPRILRFTPQKQQSRSPRNKESNQQDTAVALDITECARLSLPKLTNAQESPQTYQIMAKNFALNNRKIQHEDQVSSIYIQKDIDLERHHYQEEPISRSIDRKNEILPRNQKSQKPGQLVNSSVQRHRAEKSTFNSSNISANNNNESTNKNFEFASIKNSYYQPSNELEKRVASEENIFRQSQWEGNSNREGYLNLQRESFHKTSNAFNNLKPEEGNQQKQSHSNGKSSPEEKDRNQKFYSTYFDFSNNNQNDNLNGLILANGQLNQNDYLEGDTRVSDLIQIYSFFQTYNQFKTFRDPKVYNWNDFLSRNYKRGSIYRDYEPSCRVDAIQAIERSQQQQEQDQIQRKQYEQRQKLDDEKQRLINQERRALEDAYAKQVLEDMEKKIKLDKEQSREQMVVKMLTEPASQTQLISKQLQQNSSKKVIKAISQTTLDGIQNPSHNLFYNPFTKEVVITSQLGQKDNDESKMNNICIKTCNSKDQGPNCEFEVIQVSPFNVYSPKEFDDIVIVRGKGSNKVPKQFQINYLSLGGHDEQIKETLAKSIEMEEYLKSNNLKNGNDANLFLPTNSLHIFKEKNQLIFLTQFDEYLNFRNIVENLNLMGQMLSESELLYFFYSVIKIFLQLQSLSIVHQNFGLDSLCMCLSTFKIYHKKLENLMLLNQKTTQSDLQCHSIYIPPEYTSFKAQINQVLFSLIKTENSNQQFKNISMNASQPNYHSDQTQKEYNWMEGEKYMLGILFLCLKFNISDQRLSTSLIESKLMNLELMTEDLTSKIILELVDKNEFIRSQVNLSEILIRIQKDTAYGGFKKETLCLDILNKGSKAKIFQKFHHVMNLNKLFILTHQFAKAKAQEKFLQEIVIKNFSEESLQMMEILYFEGLRIKNSSEESRDSTQKFANQYQEKILKNQDLVQKNKESDYVQYLLLLGDLYNQCGQHTQAVENFSKIIGLQTLSTSKETFLVQQNKFLFYKSLYQIMKTYQNYLKDQSKLEESYRQAEFHMLRDIQPQLSFIPQLMIQYQIYTLFSTTVGDEKDWLRIQTRRLELKSKILNLDENEIVKDYLSIKYNEISKEQQANFLKIHQIYGAQTVSNLNNFIQIYQKAVSISIEWNKSDSSGHIVDTLIEHIRSSNINTITHNDQISITSIINSVLSAYPNMPEMISKMDLHTQFINKLKVIPVNEVNKQTAKDQ